MGFQPEVNIWTNQCPSLHSISNLTTGPTGYEEQDNFLEHVRKELYTCENKLFLMGEVTFHVVVIIVAMFISQPSAR